MLHGNENEKTLATINSRNESIKYNFKQNKEHESIYLLFHLHKVYKQAKLIYGVIIWVPFWGKDYE